MKSIYLSTVTPIAAIFSFRMLGLFMLIPVFTLFAPHLDGATPMLIGLALGSYGLSQGLLQIPFGLLSDHFGRKPILTIGLILFMIGSLLGAFAHSITAMIIARTIQGMGAIGSVLIALLADLTPEHQRTYAMAMIGGSIALSFGISFMISPLLISYAGLSSIFYFTAFLSLLALVLLHTVIPTPQNDSNHRQQTCTKARLKKVMTNIHLQRLNLGIFCEHLILTATFFAAPLRLHQAVIDGHLHATWHFYLPLLTGSMFIMALLIYYAERKKHTKTVFLGAILTTMLCQIGLLFSPSSWIFFVIYMFTYFVAFNVLEAMLPSMISKQAPASSKGAAMGIYSSSQFLGIFVGGSLSGLFFQWYASTGIFIMNSAIAFIWLLTTLRMKFNQETNCSESCDSV